MQTPAKSELSKKSRTVSSAETSNDVFIDIDTINAGVCRAMLLPSAAFPGGFLWGNHHPVHHHHMLLERIKEYYGVFGNLGTEKAWTLGSDDLALNMKRWLTANLQYELPEEAHGLTEKFAGFAEDDSQDRELDKSDKFSALAALELLLCGAEARSISDRVQKTTKSVNENCDRILQG